MSLADKLNKIAENQQKIFDAGKAEAFDPAAAAVMALLRRCGTKTDYVYDEYNASIGVVENVFVCETIEPLTGMAACPFIIVPPQVTYIGNSISSQYNAEFFDQIVLCLPTVPPITMWQGDWSLTGGNRPPRAIYVPDGSVDAYKVATNWVEFADLINPMSELTLTDFFYVGRNEEEHFTIAITKGTTWEELINSRCDEYGFLYLDNTAQNYLNYDEENVYFNDSPIVHHATGIYVKHTDVIEIGAVYDTI